MNKLLVTLAVAAVSTASCLAMDSELQRVVLQDLRSIIVDFEVLAVQLNGAIDDVNLGADPLSRKAVKTLQDITYNTLISARDLKDLKAQLESNA